MANKEKIDYLLLDIRELETQIAGMRNAEVYPVSFFSQTFDLTHKILKELHALEATQIEALRRQMEAHQAVLQSIPEPVAEPIETGREPEKTEQEPFEEISRPEPEPQTEQPETPPTPQQPEAVPTGQPTRSLSDVLEKRNLSDLRKAFSLNDRFRFRHDLFGNDDNLMMDTICKLNAMESFDDALAYLRANFKWDEDNPTVTYLLDILHRRFY